MRDFSTIEIRDLTDRCLINDKDYWISMHSLIREMGREIILLESPKNPGERSRLWCPNDINEVLKEQKGTKKIEMIVLNSPMKNMKYNTKTFKNMENLRFLQIDEVHLDGNFKYLRNKMLRCLNWNRCPLKYIPSNCSFEKLVHMDMMDSNIKEFRAPLKYFPCLEVLNLDDSKHLTRTPDFSGSQNIRKLSFGRCLSLEKVHSSIGELRKLVTLSFVCCRKLKKLPNSLSQLSSLQRLYLTQSNIYGLPSNMSHLCMLQSIYLGYSNNLEVLPKLPHNVKHIILSDCKNLKVIQELPSNLREIRLDGCENLEMLPKLPPNLRDIDLNDCEKLKMLPELPHELEILSGTNCKSMETVPNLSYLTKLKLLDFGGCRKLKEIQGWDQPIWVLSESIIKEVVLMGPKMDSEFTCTLPCNEIPSWITCKEEGSSICIQWPECNSDKYTMGFLGFMFSVVFKGSALDPPFLYFYFGYYMDLVINACYRANQRIPHPIPLEREYISVLHLCLSSHLRDDEFCTDIKAGQVMKLSTVDIRYGKKILKKIEENRVNKIGVAALYRDTDGLPQFVPITKLG